MSLREALRGRGSSIKLQFKMVDDAGLGGRDLRNLSHLGMGAWTLPSLSFSFGFLFAAEKLVRQIRQTTVHTANTHTHTHTHTYTSIHSHTGVQKLCNRQTHHTHRTQQGHPQPRSSNRPHTPTHITRNTRGTHRTSHMTQHSHPTHIALTTVHARHLKSLFSRTV